MSKSIDLNEKLLSPKQVAEYLGVSRRYVYALIEKGVINKVKLNGIVRIHPSELEKIF
tara:strand:- start:194 stop:367 length:174 start_codon:yes stop_codon:yes gene_type:complete